MLEEVGALGTCSAGDNRFSAFLKFLIKDEVWLLVSLSCSWNLAEWADEEVENEDVIGRAGSSIN